MIAAVSAAVSPQFSRRLSSPVAVHSNTSDVARGTLRGLARARLLRAGTALGTWMLRLGLAILVGSAAAEAQQAAPAGPTPWRVYFGGSALLSSQPAGSDTLLCRLHRLICSDPATYEAEEIAPALGAWIAQVGGGVQVSWARLPSPGSDIPGPTGRGNARGQASPHRGYVGGAITVSHQPDGYADGYYLSAPLGGTGTGFSGVVGGFITRNLSLEAEVSIGPALTAEQWTYGGATRNSTSYRDTLLSAFLRWHAPPFAQFAIEPVGGLTITAGHAARTAVDHYPHYAFPDEWGPPHDASVTRIRFGIGGGADLVVPATRSLAVTASFRLHVLDRDDEPYERPELGIGPWIMQFGGGVRWTF